MKLFALVMLVCLALVRPAFARVLGDPESLRLKAIELVPKKHVLAELGLVKPVDFGGGDGIVSGPARTLGWVALFTGAGGVAIGGVMLRNDESSRPGLALLGGGALLGLAGAGLLFATGLVGCATCGLVENTSHLPLPARDAFAGFDVKRKADGFRKVTVLKLRF